MSDPPPAAPEHLRVGRFDLHPKERLLSLDGKPMELGGRAFDLLLVLVENHGRLATKSLLVERVWPGLVVDENNLPAQIASLRRALGAGAIRTISGHGYRLELPVAILAAPLAPPSRGAASPAPVSAPLIPGRLTPLVGRDVELAELLQIVAHGKLTTIAGAAGAGKTRLALELAAAPPAQAGMRTAWVSLQSINDLQLVPSAIALALGLGLPRGADGFAGLRRQLEDMSLLLVLDNAEHLGEALAAPLTELLLHNRELRLLVTSQAPLGLPGETVYRLAELPLPPQSVAKSVVGNYASVELFLQRAHAADRHFELTEANASQIAGICRRLDGNPLAIELAAARVPALGVSGLLERLDDRFQILKVQHRTHDRRHGTLHAAFDWSYELLAPHEQRVFNRLGAFAGSFRLQQAVRCIADQELSAGEVVDLVGRLVDRSLVLALQTDPPRYRLLETAREFALTQLRAGGALDDAQRHMTVSVLELLDAAYQEYWSVDESGWLQRYLPDLENLRVAMDWAADNDAELGVALYGSSWPLFVEADLHAEARRRFDRMVTLLRDGLSRDRVGRFWNAVATYDSQRQWDRARYAAELGAQMHRDAGNQPAHFYALTLLAVNCRGDEAAARVAFEAARGLEDPAWQPRLLAQGALTEGALLTGSGEFAAARTAYARAMRLAVTTGERQALSATVSIVELDIACGNLGGALQLARPLAQSLRHSGRRETYFELLTLLFSALLLTDEIEAAQDAGAELYQLALQFDTSRLYLVLDAMAYLACVDGRTLVGAQLLHCSQATHAARGQNGLRPVEARMRAAVQERLAANVESASVRGAAAPRDRLDEITACALALGLVA